MAVQLVVVAVVEAGQCFARFEQRLDSMQVCRGSQRMMGRRGAFE